MPRLRYTPIALALTTLLSAQHVAAQTANTENDIVISASRVETKRIETGSAITILDAQYLQENQARSVAEVLQDVPGVSVKSTGGLGQGTSVFIRGAKSEQTLVIIDGIEVNDLSTPDGGYDFAHLMANNIERIEILRGSQSALWGSDAMGGVINIITKKGQAGFQQKTSFEVGENDYHKETVTVSGAQGNSHYSLSASNLETNGINVHEIETDDDSYENQNVTLKAGHQFSDIFAVDTVLRYTDAEGEYDNIYATETISDSGYYSTSRQRQVKLNTNLDLLDKQLQNRLSIAFSDSDREYPSYSSEYKGQKIKTDLQSDYYLKTINGYSQRVSFAAEHENDKYEDTSSKYEMEASGIVLGYGADWQKTVFVNAAVRQDFNSKFDDTTTYHLDISAWVSDGTRFHASHGTGVKNPTFGQLYGWGGDPTLDSETSRSWDAGIEYNFADIDAYIDITYFDSLYTDMITSDLGSGYNYYTLDGKTTARGVELTGSLKITQDFRANASYTFMETDDSNGNELTYRPKHSASINASYKYTPQLSANIGARYVGDRMDSDASTLDSYTVVNIAAAYQVNEHMTLSARLDNAFDKDYEEVSGYNTDERTAYVGVSFQ